MFHAVDIGPLSYLNMWNFVPPVKTKDFLHRLDVVVFQSSEVASIQCPKKKNRNTHGVVDCHFGQTHRQTESVTDTLFGNKGRL